MNRLLLIPSVAVSAALATPAAAAGNDTGFFLQANVDTFCRLSLGEASVDDDGSVGSVRETCNTPGGYVVEASFDNLKSGTVQADQDEAALDDGGQVRFTSDQARRRTRLWSVLGGVRANPAQPVVVRFSITPL